MKCSRCGAELMGGAQFCAHCGAPVAGGQGSPKPSKGNGNIVIIGIIAVIIVVAVGVIAVLFALGVFGGSSGGSSSAASSATAAASTASTSSAAASKSATASGTTSPESDSSASAPSQLGDEFVGTWKLVRIMDTGEGGYWEDVRALQKQGVIINLEITSDNKAALVLQRDRLRGSWKATNEDTGTIHFQGETLTMRIRDDMLILEHGDAKMEFDKK